MTTLTIDLENSKARDIQINEDTLHIILNDGRTVTVPIAWYPRIMHATQEERGNWRLIGGGLGIHWPELDEDISIENIIAGKPSGESQTSFKKWLESRKS